MRFLLVPVILLTFVVSACSDRSVIPAEGGELAGQQEIEQLEGSAVDPVAVPEDSGDDSFPGGAGDAVVEAGSGTIEVTAFRVEALGTHVHLELNGVPGFRVFPEDETDDSPSALRQRLDDQARQIYLVDGKGLQYRYEGGNYAADHYYCTACASGASWFSHLYLEFPPLQEDAGAVILVLPMTDGSEVEVEIENMERQ